VGKNELEHLTIAMGKICAVTRMTFAMDGVAAKGYKNLSEVFDKGLRGFSFSYDRADEDIAEEMGEYLTPFVHNAEKASPFEDMNFQRNDNGMLSVEMKFTLVDVNYNVTIWTKVIKEEGESDGSDGYDKFEDEESEGDTSDEGGSDGEGEGKKRKRDDKSGRMDDDYSDSSSSGDSIDTVQVVLRIKVKHHKV
jgi:hypothetical protein